jgi:hypothetical protein
MLPIGGFLTVSSAGTHCSGPHLVYGFLTTELSARPNIANWATPDTANHLDIVPT